LGMFSPYPCVFCTPLFRSEFFSRFVAGVVFFYFPAVLFVVALLFTLVSTTLPSSPAVFSVVLCLRIFVPPPPPIFLSVSPKYYTLFWGDPRVFSLSLGTTFCTMHRWRCTASCFSTLVRLPFGFFFAWPACSRTYEILFFYFCFVASLFFPFFFDRFRNQTSVSLFMVHDVLLLKILRWHFSAPGLFCFSSPYLLFVFFRRSSPWRFFLFVNSWFFFLSPV